MQSLVENPDIVLALDKGNIDDPYDLIYTSIFPYLRVPNTVTESGCFIALKIDSSQVKRNDTYKNLIITFAIVVKQDKMKTSWNATRTDLISGVIIDELNWSDILGFDMELIGTNENILLEDYHVREISFQVLAANYSGC